MKIVQERKGAVTVVRPEGPLAVPDVDEFRDRLLEVFRESLGRLVVDASGIALVDSKALEALVEVNEEMAASGKVLKLCGANKTLRQVLELTELTNHFEHFEDVNAAVRSFL